MGRAVVSDPPSPDRVGRRDGRGGPTGPHGVDDLDLVGGRGWRARRYRVRAGQRSGATRKSNGLAWAGRFTPRR